MRPLAAVGPAALMRLFQEALLVRVDAVVHEGGELVFYLLELVVGDRLRDGGEAAPAACRVRQPCGRQPCGGEQESHALLCCFLRLLVARSTRFALQLVAGEALDIYACADVPLVQRGWFASALPRRGPAPLDLALAAIDAEIPGGRALRASSKPREV